MIDDYLNQTATLKQQASVAADGSRTYTLTTIECRFEPKYQQVTTRDGETVVSNARIFTLAHVAIGDAITFASRTWPVVAVFERYGRDSLSHYEVLL